MASLPMDVNALLSPPILVFPNLEFNGAEPTLLDHGLCIAPLSHLRDETFFAELLNSGMLGPLLQDETLARRAVVYMPGEEEFKVSDKTLRRFRRLLCLHIATPRFDPSRVQSLLIQFIRSDSSMLPKDRVLCEGRPIAAEQLIRQLLGLAAANPTQSVWASEWCGFDDDLVDGVLGEDYNEGSIFALTLQHVLNADLANLDDALDLFSLGIQQRGVRKPGLAAALIVAAFENLFPIHGKEKVSAQFETVGTMLLPHKHARKWFHELYDIRSRQFHGDSKVPNDKSKSANEHPALVRDIEVTKVVFAYCVFQLEVLNDTEDALREHDVSPKTVWWRYVDSRIKQDNDSICKVLTKTPTTSAIFCGPRFDPDDKTATSDALIRAGMVLLCLQAHHFPLKDFASGYINSMLKKYLPESMDRNPLEKLIADERRRISVLFSPEEEVSKKEHGALCRNATESAKKLKKQDYGSIVTWIKYAHLIFSVRAHEFFEGDYPTIYALAGIELCESWSNTVESHDWSASSPCD